MSINIHVYYIQYKYIGKCEFTLYASRAPFPVQSAKIKYRYVCFPGPSECKKLHIEHVLLRVYLFFILWSLDVRIVFIFYTKRSLENLYLLSRAIPRQQTVHSINRNTNSRVYYPAE